MDPAYYEHQYVPRGYELYDDPRFLPRYNEVLPSDPPENKNKKPKKPVKAPAKPTARPGAKPAGKPGTKPIEHSPSMKEEMDYLAHQRMLKDKSMRRKREKE